MSQVALPFELPTRRVSRAERLVHPPEGNEQQRPSHTFYVHCGFHPDGSVREIFVSAKRETNDLVEIITDTCILISKQLQAGARLVDLAVHAPSGFLAAIIALAIKIETEETESVRAQYAQSGAA